MPVPTISKRFGLTVRKYRTEAGLTQEALAERAGLHATYIGMVERGIRNPTLDVALRISKALKAELPVLISKSLPDRGGKGRKG